MKAQNNSSKINGNNSINNSNANHFNRVLAIQGMNALENTLRKQGSKTERVNVPLHKTQAFYEACGENKLPFRQIPELAAVGYRFGVMVRLDAANRPLLKICCGFDRDPSKYCQITVEDLAGAGWFQKSTWYQPGLSREERGQLATAITDAAAVIVDKFDAIDIGVDEAGKLAFAKIK